MTDLRILAEHLYTGCREREGFRKERDRPLAYPQFAQLSSQELSEYVDLLEANLPRVVTPVIASMMELTIAAATGELYSRHKAAGDHESALAVLDAYGSRN